jgi:hypothetical protein
MLNWWSYIFGIPTAQNKTYLPNTIRSAPYYFYTATNVNNAPLSVNPNSQDQLAHQSATTTLQRYATNLPSHDDLIQINTVEHANNNALSISSQTAITKRTVMVIYFPGYGGAPRAEVNQLTQELIAYLKEATIYHGYKYAVKFQAKFLGQDGMGYAGVGCTSGSTPDNIHIRLTGVKTDVTVSNYRIEDPAGYGVWANPCNPISNWFIHAQNSNNGQADLYFKPFRDAPDGTIYTITVQYSDGTSQTTSVVGTRVAP